MVTGGVAVARGVREAVGGAVHAGALAPRPVPPDVAAGAAGRGEGGVTHPAPVTVRLTGAVRLRAVGTWRQTEERGQKLNFKCTNIYFI